MQIRELEDGETANPYPYRLYEWRHLSGDRYFWSITWATSSVRALAAAFAQAVQRAHV